MGFLDALAGGIKNSVNEMKKKQYKEATHRDYDYDYQMFMHQYEHKSDNDISYEWDKLREDTGIRNSAKKAALRELMKEKGMRSQL